MVLRKPIISRTFLYLLIIGLAFALKFAYLKERSSLPDFSYPTLDSRYHDDWAWGVASGEWEPRIAGVRDEPYFRAPLYPYFLSSLYRVFGHDYFAARLIQIIVGSISALLLFLLVQMLFGAVTAWIGLALYLAYWPITYFEAELLIPVVIIFLDLLFLVTLIRGVRNDKLILWILSGIFLGLSAIARPNVLLIVIPVLLWIWQRSFSSRAYSARRAIVAFLVACMVPILAVTIRNEAKGNEFVLVSSQGGVNFYIGNNPDSKGVKAVVPGTREDWWGGYDDTKIIAETASGRSLKPSEISNYWFSKGLEFILQHPAGAAKLYLRKIALFLGNGEVSNNRQLYFVRDQSGILRTLPVNFAFVFAAAVLGIILLFKKTKSNRTQQQRSKTAERKLLLYFIIPYSASVIIFFVTSRYRLPVSVLLIPYAAYALKQFFDRMRRREWSWGVKACLAFFVVFIASMANPFKVGSHALHRGYYDIGVDYMNSDYEKAAQYFTKTIELAPDYAPAWKMRGQACFELRSYDRAIEDLKVACQLDSTFTSAQFYLGAAYHISHRYDRALECYERVLRLQPDHKFALNNTADIYMCRKEYEKARKLIERVLELDPKFDQAIYGMGLYYEETGEYELAIDYYMKASNLPAARLRLAYLLIKKNEVKDAENLDQESKEKSSKK